MDDRNTLLTGSSPISLQMVKIFLSVLFFIFFSNALYADAIYYRKGDDGVMCFTDIPVSEEYKVFRVFGASITADRAQIDRLVQKACTRYKMDEQLVHAMIQIESAYDCSAVSSAGAQGLMQIMPETGKDLGLETPFDPAGNIDAGVRYFRSLMDRFNSLPLALAAYNAGPGAVDKHGGIPPYAETRSYVGKVMKLYAKLKPKQ
ncbi:MAG TPA: lytic transglycosylase domain-containing protein [Desulfomicrobiaceae bacterium]|nr:lytic transglycosylase domain-containing protein [Desulfomicrobiaceae bacterium]